MVLILLSSGLAGCGPSRADLEAVDYAPERFPGVFRCLHDILVLPWNERFTEEHVDFIADAVRTQHARLRGGR